MHALHSAHRPTLAASRSARTHTTTNTLCAQTHHFRLKWKKIALSAAPKNKKNHMESAVESPQRFLADRVACIVLSCIVSWKGWVLQQTVLWPTFQLRLTVTDDMSVTSPPSPGRRASADECH
jgi:hypothetical protein